MINTHLTSQTDYQVIKYAWLSTVFGSYVYVKDFTQDLDLSMVRAAKAHLLPNYSRRGYYRPPSGNGEYSSDQIYLNDDTKEICVISAKSVENITNAIAALVCSIKAKEINEEEPFWPFVTRHEGGCSFYLNTKKKEILTMLRDEPFLSPYWRLSSFDSLNDHPFTIKQMQEVKTKLLMNQKDINCNQLELERFSLLLKTLTGWKDTMLTAYRSSVTIDANKLYAIGHYIILTIKDQLEDICKDALTALSFGIPKEMTAKKLAEEYIKANAFDKLLNNSIEDFYDCARQIEWGKFYYMLFSSQEWNDAVEAAVQIVSDKTFPDIRYLLF